MDTLVENSTRGEQDRNRAEVRDHSRPMVEQPTSRRTNALVQAGRSQARLEIRPYGFRDASVEREGMHIQPNRVIQVKQTMRRCKERI